MTKEELRIHRELAYLRAVGRYDRHRRKSRPNLKQKNAALKNLRIRRTKLKHTP